MEKKMEAPRPWTLNCVGAWLLGAQPEGVRRRGNQRLHGLKLLFTLA